MSGSDPTVIRSLAVTRSDVVNAFVYTRENPETAVLRVTPPFHGRMRARLHVYYVEDAAETGAIHIAPETLLEADVVALYPDWDADAEIDGDIENGGDSETDNGSEKEGGDVIDSTVEPYADAVSAWRNRARTAIVDEIDFVVPRTEESPAMVSRKTENHTVRISILE